MVLYLVRGFVFIYRIFRSLVSDLSFPKNYLIQYNRIFELKRLNYQYPFRKKKNETTLLLLTDICYNILPLCFSNFSIRLRKQMSLISVPKNYFVCDSNLFSRERWIQKKYGHNFPQVQHLLLITNLSNNLLRLLVTLKEKLIFQLFDISPFVPKYKSFQRF